MIVSRVQDAAPSSSTRSSPHTAVSHFPVSAAAACASAVAVANPSACVIRVAAERATYTPFRSTFFHDPVVNPRLRDDGGEPDDRVSARESRRLWTANGPLINPRTAKTATCPGSAFKNQALSADRLYSTNRQSLGYDVHRSLRGTSLCSTTKRFDMKPRTAVSVGPGSYNLTVAPCRQIHHPPQTEPPRSTVAVLPSDRLTQWGGRPDLRPMDSADEWKITSDKPSPTAHTFQRSHQGTWIDQIEARQRRTDPLATPLPLSAKERARRARPETRLPNFVQGTRNPVATKASAIAMLNQSLQQREQQALSPTVVVVPSPPKLDHQTILVSIPPFEPTAS